MNEDLQELIAKLVYKTTDETGWAPQNKLGQHLARIGRSVKELGYEKMSGFFQDHTDRFQVEKDEHGLPIVKLIGEAPAMGSLEEEEIMRPQGYFRGVRQSSVQPRMPRYQQGGYSKPSYGMGQSYGSYGMNNRRGMYNDQRHDMYNKRRPEQLSLFRWAFFPDREEWLQMLADLAMPQVWQYEVADEQHPNPALFDYLRDVFRRLQLEGKVLESHAEGLALFNTGLVDREEQRPIYAVFGRNPNRNRQPWLFQEFFLSSAPLLAQASQQQMVEDTIDDAEDSDEMEMTEEAE
ncbi:MAG: DUF3825 domain-containing protein [Muribaculaceae bacterium]|nr:DUF3825 domain-containing protein [Muribaculaceae bacterium]